MVQRSQKQIFVKYMPTRLYWHFSQSQKHRYSISHAREVQSCLVSGNREQGIDVYFISLKNALSKSKSWVKFTHKLEKHLLCLNSKA